MSLIICLFLSGVLFICDGLHVLGPSGPLIVKLGGSVMLPCYVEAPISPEQLEVEWKRTDSDTLVHLFQDGECKPEAQDQAYSGRASFFTEEVKRGNFSLLLTDLVTNDAGVYNCTVYRQQETDQTSVEIEYLIVTGGHAVSAYVHEDFTLSCSVDSHISPEELEVVSWKKVDQDITVLVFQEGEVQTDFTHERFRDRVEFFGPEEIHKGNFSLRIKTLRMEDKGLYRCEVLSGEVSAHTTVEILPLDSHIPPEELEVVSWKKVDQDITVLVFQEGEVQTDFTHERFRDRVESFGPEEIHKGNFSLRIKTLRMEDKGLYRCEVLSGEVSAHTTVEILPLGFSHIHNIILVLCIFTCLGGFLSSILYTFYKEPGSCTEIIQHVLVFGPNILMFVAFIIWGVLNGFISEAATCSTINLLRTLWLLVFCPYFKRFHGRLQRFLAVPLITVEWVVLSVIAAAVIGRHGWGTQNILWMGFAGFSPVLNIIVIVAVILIVLSGSDWTALCLFFAVIFRCVADGFMLVILFLTREVIDTNGNVGLILLTILSVCCVILVFTVIWRYVRGEMAELLALIRKLYPSGAAVLFIVNSVTLVVELIRQAGEGERTVEDLRLILLPFEAAFLIICSFVSWRSCC
ncbi:uncharacterized protein LOC118809627 isoform X2 [Colossoma macropomum]|uniref:uncharacterized protein LOC118809627 isoform X2 n=1 Tax=Colossoma macropomum TaxID=42526 RepID=UPI001865422F|nr:uncharacterized protein LOC118809627 isoform X2 [Colossoma macropomum]